MKFKLMMSVSIALALIVSSSLSALCADTTKSPAPSTLAANDVESHVVKTMPLLTYLKHSPFKKRYDQSIKLPVGAPGKSKYIERQMDLLNLMPWVKDEKVQFVSADSPNRDYRFDANSVVLKAGSSPEEELMDFTHQAYHVTNKLFTKLYVDEKLTKDSFIQLYFWAEVAALVTELSAGKNLNIEWKPVYYAETASGAVNTVDVFEVEKAKGMKGLYQQLFHCYVRGSRDNFYIDYYATLYKNYTDTYAVEKPKAEKVIDHCKNDLKIDYDDI